MTIGEKEAIEYMSWLKRVMENSDKDSKPSRHFRTIIRLCEEVKEYRKLGTLEELRAREDDRK